MDFGADEDETIGKLPIKCSTLARFLMDPHYAPICWLLEGLLMYLKKEDAETLLKELSALSNKDSYIILNFMAGHPACMPDELDALLCGQLGWTKVETLYFGDKDFNYGKYPEGKKANDMLGFSFYKK